MRGGGGGGGGVKVIVVRHMSSISCVGKSYQVFSSNIV